MTPDISVIICTYNRELYLPEALTSLVKQDFDKAKFEVIVVNNNSTDKTEAVCRDFISRHAGNNIYYYNEQQQGSSPARNNGATHAKGKLFIFMDDDAIAEKDFLRVAWDYHIANPSVHGFGGRIIPRYIPSEPKWMSHYLSGTVGNFDYAKEIVEFSPNKYPLESNMAVTKKAFEENNGFDVALPGVKGTLRIGGEGKDFFLRLKEKGYKIFYIPGMIVHHVVEVKKLTKEYLYNVASGYGRGERQRMSSQGKMAYYKKLVEYLFKLGAAVVIGFFYFITFRPAKTWPLVQFRIDAIKGLTGH